MRSVKTVRPFGRTVRRRFLSVFVIIRSDSIVGDLGSVAAVDSKPSRNALC